MNAHRDRIIRRSFTLTELLVVIMVIGILSSSLLFAMYNAVQQAKESRTRAQITKLHELLMTRWDSYRTRAIRLNIAGPARRDGRAVAAARVIAMRDLMRMELPERKTEVWDDPVSFGVPYSYDLTTTMGIQNFSGSVTVNIARPPVLREYRRRVENLVSPANLTTGMAAWTEPYQGAECLYMIIASMQDITGNALDFFQETEIGDKDGDGMPEIWDAWGNPIEFLRWAPGYFASPGPDGNWGVAGADDDSNSTVDDISEALWPGSDDMMIVSDLQKRDPQESPDPFDPLRIFPGSFALYPLIYSAGPDGLYDINVPNGLRYTQVGNAYYPNNPYHIESAPAQFPPGTPMDANNDGQLSFMDNIVNHAMGG
jgi:prepilin-type N-terminal cleavage/methylation domain-containing protein